MSAREMLRRGEFNTMNQSVNPDGSVDIVLTRRGDRNRYHLIVEHLYQYAERVLVDEILPPERRQAWLS